MLVKCDDSGPSRIKDGVSPGVDVPHQPGRGDVVDVSVDAKVGIATDVEGVQGDKDGGFLPELAPERVESDFVATAVGTRDEHPSC